MFLLSGQNFQGSGTAQSFRWSDKTYFYVSAAGNSATATLYASPDGASHWLPITAIAVKGTASAQLTGFYPYILAEATWISGGTVTAQLYVAVEGRNLVS